MKNIFIFTLCMLLAGCAKYQYAPKPVIPEQIAKEYSSRQLDGDNLRKFFEDYNYPIEKWPLPELNLSSLTLAAYFYHPEIQIALADYAFKKVQEENAKRKINPNANIPLEHHSDTSDGRSPWLIGIIFDFIFEREAKRNARLEMAMSESNVARTNIQFVAWEIFRELKQKLINLYTGKISHNILQKQFSKTSEMLEVLEKRKELGEASEFELSSSRLEMQALQLTLARNKVFVIDSESTLASRIGVPYSALKDKSYSFVEIEAYLEDNSMDFGTLQEFALKHRVDIKKLLDEYAVKEAELKLEIEKQYPDLVLSPGFIFDQDDKIWALAASWVLPLFHPQNEGPILEALADRERAQRKILALQASIINNISTAQTILNAQWEALILVRELLDELKNKMSDMQRQFELGYIDRIELIRGELEIIIAEKAVFDIEMSVINAASLLEDAIQYPLHNVSYIKYMIQ